MHSFNPAVPPPWETRTDFDVFRRIAESFSRLAEKHLGVRRDVIAAPLMHDTPDELAQPFGEGADWKAGECEPIPGRTMPKLVVVERDYPATRTAGSRSGRSWRSSESVQGRHVEAAARGGGAGPPERCLAQRQDGGRPPGA